MPETKPDKKNQVNVALTEDQLATLVRLQSLTKKSRPAIFTELLEIYGEDFEQLFHEQIKLVEEHKAKLKERHGTPPLVELPKLRKKAG